MARPRALDLFCGAGGVSVGLERAGFDVTGVDIEPMPRYRGGTFVQADAITYPLDGFDLIWASPPCQAHSRLRHRTGKSYADIISRVRELLRVARSHSLRQDRPMATVIENVPEAPLRRDALLCGSMFGLDVRRHRIFECAGFHPYPLECRHELQAPRFPRVDKRLPEGRLASVVTVCGTGGKHGPDSLSMEQKAMGIEWMVRSELTQAIPPAYSAFIGRHARRVLEI